MTSRQLIEHAIQLYSAGFERLRRRVSDDPDIGSGPRFVSGLRSLKARHEAQPFSLDGRTIDRYRTILDQAPIGSIDQEAAWLESFPRLVLSLLDRRRIHVATALHGRRWMDRVLAARPRPRSDPKTVSNALPAG